MCAWCKCGAWLLTRYGYIIRLWLKFVTTRPIYNPILVRIWHWLRCVPNPSVKVQSTFMPRRIEELQLAKRRFVKATVSTFGAHTRHFVTGILVHLRLQGTPPTTIETFMKFNEHTIRLEASQWLVSDISTAEDRSSANAHDRSFFQKRCHRHQAHHTIDTNDAWRFQIEANLNSRSSSCMSMRYLALTDHQ